MKSAFTPQYELFGIPKSPKSPRNSSLGSSESWAPRAPMRPGSTLIELMIFIALLSATIGVVIALLVATNDSRIRQQVISTVEQNGVQLLQTLTRRVRGAERIRYPAAGQTGAVLMVQMASENEDPTVIALSGGALIVARHDTLQTLSSSQVTILDLEVRNTSAADDKPSAMLQFTVSKSLAAPVRITYTRPFEALISFFPDDEPEGNECVCGPPDCINGQLEWLICGDGCFLAPFTVPC